MKIVFIAYHFPPVGGAGVQRPQKFAQYLPEHGIQPTVITGPAMQDGRWTPQDVTLLHGIPASVSIHRVSGPQPPASAPLRRRCERILRLDTPFAKWWVSSAVELGRQIGRDAAVILATMSPFESGEVAQRLSRALGKPWVADLRDPWALDEMQLHPSRLHRWLESKKMGKLLASAALVIMNTPEAAAAVRECFPFLREKTTHITNGFDQKDFTSSLPNRKDGKFRVVHCGYLHTNTGLQLRNQPLRRLLGGAVKGVDILTRSHTFLLQAAERLCENRLDIQRDLEILLAGETSQQDREVAHSSPIAGSVTFSGYLSHVDSVACVRTADLLFLPMHKLRPGSRSRVVPGKTYEYMAAQVPVLAAVPDGDARDFLACCGSALICRPDDISGIAEAIEKAYDAWKSGDVLIRPDTEYIQQFERRNLTRDLARALHRAAGIQVAPAYKEPPAAFAASGVN